MSEEEANKAYIKRKMELDKYLNSVNILIFYKLIII